MISAHQVTRAAGIPHNDPSAPPSKLPRGTAPKVNILRPLVTRPKSASGVTLVTHDIVEMLKAITTIPQSRLWAMIRIIDVKFGVNAAASINNEPKICKKAVATVIDRDV